MDGEDSSIVSQVPASDVECETLQIISQVSASVVDGEASRILSSMFPEVQKDLCRCCFSRYLTIAQKEQIHRYSMRVHVCQFLVFLGR